MKGKLTKTKRSEYMIQLAFFPFFQHHQDSSSYPSCHYHSHELPLKLQSSSFPSLLPGLNMHPDL
jgi:hypothetical protein